MIHPIAGRPMIYASGGRRFPKRLRSLGSNRLFQSARRSEVFEIIDARSDGRFLGQKQIDSSNRPLKAL